MDNYHIMSLESMLECKSPSLMKLKLKDLR